MKIIQINKEWASKGFALVATISILSLVLLVALALVSLSSTTAQASGHSDHIKIAKGNARMALNMAVAQLQKQMGPDQRVSIRAGAMMGSTGVDKQSGWIGVYNSNTLKDGTELFTRTSTASLIDARSSTAGFDRQVESIDWLVTRGNTSANPFLAISGDKVEIRSGFENNSGVDIPAVEVPMMQIEDGSGLVTGALAWWSDDLSQKANLRNDKRFRNASLASDDISNFIAPSGYGFSDTKLQSHTATAVKKYITGESVDLSLAEVGYYKRLRDDYTVHSSSLLVDVQNGGVKKDLSAFISSNSDLANWGPYSALKGSDSILDPVYFSKFGPKWSIVRDWMRLSNSVTKSGSDYLIDVTAPVNKFLTLSSNITQDTHMSATGISAVAVADLENNTRVSIAPTLALAEIGLKVAIEGNTEPIVGETRKLVFQFLPRVVLWNPYNVTLRSKGYYVRMSYPWRLQLMWAGATPSPVNRNGDGTTDINFDTSGSSRAREFVNPVHEAIFYIEPTEIKAGESLMFTPKVAKDWSKTTKPSELVLSASEADTPNTAAPHVFSIKESEVILWPGAQVDDSVEITRDDPTYRLNFERWRASRGGAGNNGKKRKWQLYMADPSVTDWKDIQQDSANLLQTVNVGEDGELGSNALIDVLPSTPLEGENGTTFPDQGRYTHRYAYLGETTGIFTELNWDGRSPYEYYKSAPIASFNLRSSWSYPSILNSWSRSSRGRHFFAPYSESMYDSPVSSSGMKPLVGAGGMLHYPPFGNSTQWAGVDNYVLYDVPKPDIGVYNIGAFQHINFSQFPWHTSYAVGNSYADIRYNPLTTTPDDTLLKSRVAWEKRLFHGVSHFVENALMPLQGHDITQSDVYHYDIAFELNNVVWDRYYISANPYGGSWVPNELVQESPNYVFWNLESQGTTFSAAAEAYHAAAKFQRIEGGFNVNSISVKAWEVLLRSVLSETQGYNGDSSSIGLACFSRTHPAIGGMFDSNDDMFSNNAWSGYRGLSGTEIAELAEAIVKQVKLRGPFLSLGDFVNRRLVDSDIGQSGALQAAIDSLSLNDGLKGDTLDDYATFYNDAVADKIDHFDYVVNWKGITDWSPIGYKNLKGQPETRARQCTAFLQQGDILQAIGGRLTVRGDTFKIRTYGQSVDKNGEVMATAWIEAVVQRTTDPMNNDTWDGIEAEPEVTGVINYGRRFEVIRQRWLDTSDI